MSKNQKFPEVQEANEEEKLEIHLQVLKKRVKSLESVFGIIYEIV
jgi:hypothetical protein